MFCHENSFNNTIYVCLVLCACLTYVLYETHNAHVVPLDLTVSLAWLEKESKRFARHRKFVILASKARSGSSIMGKLLSHNSGTYYTFEPVNLAVKSNYTMNTDEKITELLKDVFECRLFNNTSYNNLKLKNNWHKLSYSYKDLCYEYEFNGTTLNCTLEDVDIDKALCETANTHVMKTIYPSLKNYFNLLNDNDSDISLLYLVRDPRGTIASREEINSKYDFVNFTTDPSELCSEIRNDLYYADIFQRLFPKKFLLVRYEDVATNYSTTMREIYHFLGLNYTPQLEYFMRSQMVLEEEPLITDAFSTVRDARSRPLLWESETAFSKVDKIQQHCLDVLKKLSYPVFNSFYEYTNSSPLM